MRVMVEIKIAWWFTFYLYGVAFMSMTTGLPPNETKVAYWARRAVKTRIVYAPTVPL